MASVLLIADDLTGALDSAAPFRAAGVSISIALDPDGVPSAMADRPDMLVVNSDSRHIDAQAATARMAALWDQLASARAAILFKKIDSRLHGHPALETIALMTAAGRTAAHICPAVPDMGRMVVNGHIMGDGIEDPIALSDHFASGGPYHLADASDDRALERLADHILAAPQNSMAVGARGLAQAMARRMAGEGARAPEAPVIKLPMIIAIGSRDPGSRAQIAHLRAAFPDIQDIEAPGGRIARRPRADAEIILCHMTDDGADHPPDRAAACFAEEVAGLLRERRPRTLFASGGATAVAIARAIDVHSARLVGEVAPAIPAVLIAEWNDMMFLTKSGSFGPADSLTRLVADAYARGMTPCGLSA